MPASCPRDISACVCRPLGNQSTKFIGAWPLRRLCLKDRLSFLFGLATVTLVYVLIAKVARISLTSQFKPSIDFLVTYCSRFCITVFVFLGIQVGRACLVRIYSTIPASKVGRGHQ